MAVDLKKLLPRSMRIPLWQDLMDVVSSELQNFIDNKLVPHANIYNTDALTNKEDFVEISTLLGNTPDFSLNDTLSNWKKQTNSIAFKLKWKSTSTSYNYIFNSIPISGEVFNIIYTEFQSRLVRVMDDNIGSLLDAHDPSLPFVFPAATNYSETTFGFTLDYDPPYHLDDNLLYLDRASSKKLSKHIAVEICPDSLTEENSVMYYMTSTIMNYLKSNVDRTRRAIECAHPGVQISLLMDSSADPLSSGGASYSVPSMQVLCSLTDLYDGAQLYNYFNKIKIGTGVQAISSGSYPTDLANRVAEQTVLESNIAEVGHWRIFYIEFMGNTVNEEILTLAEEPPNDNTTFSTSVLTTPVKPKSVHIAYYSGSTQYELEDDGAGTLSGIKGGGSINYSTGVIELTLYREHFILEEDFGVGDGTTTAFNSTLFGTPIKTGSLTVIVTISNVIYEAHDDGSGNITLAGIVSSGTINYSTGDISITFTTAPDSSTNVYARYTYTDYSYLNSSYDVVARYETSENLPITEAGLYDQTGQLVAYGTFPPIIAGDTQNHISVQFIIKSISF